ncbi:hypothetical protein NH340_JMT05467 [Sarcoptes scabiei]|nr:hypothetical protein NH340_JMT05467 [Sarcoptes scabiei]
MFIRKIIIDGFKSYGKKVEISGFDPMFNAITGFNGSGKSNILDAICFVLGLSKLELARCHLLNDLIYKNGHAGVTTASVTLEIDNSDGKFAHTEYRNEVIVVRREINIKNQSKYYIDGFSVTKDKLLDFFHSVSLNIQNPHFLIMQGKIVKVVSMKPIEILSMIEEAVGVSVYESKKKQNLAKIEKYDLSLKEISVMIEESIKPKLSQLKEEEKSLNDYRNVCNNLDKMNKIAIAYSYLKYKKVVDNTDNIIQTLSNHINERKTEEKELQDKHEKLMKTIQKCQKKVDNELSGDFKTLESNVNENQSLLQRIQANKQLKIDSLKEETSQQEKITKKFNTEQKNFKNKQVEFEKSQENLEKLRKENESNEKLLQKAQEDLENLALGLSKGLDGEKSATLAQQLIETNNVLAECESKINKSKLVIEQNSNELKIKKQKLKSDKDAYEKGSHDIEAKQKEIDKIQKEMDEIDFTEERFDDVKQRVIQLKKDSRIAEDELHQLYSEVPGTRFNYPRNEFNENEILGVVCDLFTIKSSEHMIAIEKACGGRLFNVIVSDDEVGAALIRKNLRERRTFLPLNKIIGREADSKALKIAERLVGKGNVSYAIDLISFDPKLKNAMKHVFGDTMVCPNMNMAKKIAFAEGVMKRTVTFDGEIFDPSGTLTGGALSKDSQLLSIISNIKTVQNNLNQIQIESQQLNEELGRLNSSSKKFFELKSKLSLRIKEIELLRQRLEESSHGLLMKEINDLETIIREEIKNVEKYSEEKESIRKRIKELEFKIANVDSTKERERKETKENLELKRKKYENSSKKLQKEEQAFECLSQEIKHHEEILVNLENQIEKFQKEIDSIRGQIESIDSEIEDTGKRLEEAEAEFNQYKSLLNEKSSEIKKLQSELNSVQKRLDENEREIKIKQHEMDQTQISIKESEDHLRSLLHKHSWIKEEEKYFDSNDTEYRILNDNFDENQFHSDIKALKIRKEKLSKSVNMKASIMQGEKQKEFEDLLSKREIALQDRKKLMKFIERVERDKDTQLRKAWEKINVNFGSIFSTLLPNSNAKLVPIKNNSISDGLEIKVAFGQVWKESLSELSGGQRSLVALSLVLALLKYNPAPLYILDEIDAALDQSHTQNIGCMIRKHFRDSQVSQKNAKR